MDLNRISLDFIWFQLDLVYFFFLSSISNDFIGFGTGFRWILVLFVINNRNKETSYLQYIAEGGFI